MCGDSFTAILLYFDEMIVTGNGPNAINDVKNFLGSQFKLKDLGALKYFLIIEIAQSQKGICINQRKYTLDILQEVGLLGAKPAKFPLEQSLKLTPTEGDLLKEPTHYQRLVGKLIYLTITRPQISFSVNTLSQFMQEPRRPHLDATLSQFMQEPRRPHLDGAHRLLRYLKCVPR